MIKGIKTKEFTVQGRSPFPIDMLRYDSCWPARERDSADIIRTFYEGFKLYVASIEVRLQTDTLTFITPERWHSFGWVVIETP